MKCSPIDTDAVSQEEEQQESMMLRSPRNASKPYSVARLLKTRIDLKRIIINVSDTQYPVVSEVAEDLDWKIQTKAEASDWDVFWTDSAILPDILFRMHFFQKINHYPGIHIIARKNLLGLSLMRMREKFPREYDFFPLTWMLPSQYVEFRRHYQAVQRSGRTRTYIVKPEADSQGRGIFLTRSIEDLANGNHYVVQKYLLRPFLLEGLKFDFRIYVLLAGTNPLRIYLYDEGLVRLATQPYHEPTSLNMTDMCMHLTNYAVNKANPNFVFNTSEKNMGVGHKRALSVVLRQLEKEGHKVPVLWQQIKDIVIKTLLTGMPLIAHQYRYCQPEEYSGNMCFHILGLDIMLTDKFEPVLLEVNHTPSFTTDTPLDHHIKYKLIKDTLVLMNINLQTKKQLFQKAKECNSERLYTGRRRIFQGKAKENQIERAQQERDAYQKDNLGGYELIHPTSDPQLNKKYDEMLEIARKLYVEEGSIRNRSLKEDRVKAPSVSPVPRHKPMSSEHGINRRMGGVNTISGVKNNPQLSRMNMAVSLIPQRKVQAACNLINFADFESLETLPSKETKSQSARQPKPRDSLKQLLARSKEQQLAPNQSSVQQKTATKRHIVITSMEAHRSPEVQQQRFEEFKLSRNKFGHFLRPKIVDLNKDQEDEPPPPSYGNGALALSIRYQRSIVKRTPACRIKEYLQKKLKVTDDVE